MLILLPYITTAGYDGRENVHYLIENKIDINTADESGNTALHYFVKFDCGEVRHIDYVNILKEAGVKTNIKNKEGQYALDQFIYVSREIAKLLKDK